MSDYLVTPTAWSPFNSEDAEKHSTFECGVCSTAEHKVYHKLIGYHRHVDIEELLSNPRVANKEELAKRQAAYDADNTAWTERCKKRFSENKYG